MIVSILQMMGFGLGVPAPVRAPEPVADKPQAREGAGRPVAESTFQRDYALVES